MVTRSNTLPDPEMNLRDSRDFILNSALGRRAQQSTTPLVSLTVATLLQSVYRLVQSCHMPEFTDHGLPHLCSLVDRISRWTLGPPSTGEPLVGGLSPDESARLLLATLLHDIGMLSQSPKDLPPDAPRWKSKAANPDIADWVRKTHVDRMRGLATRLLRGTEAEGVLGGTLFEEAVAVAESHQVWPWDWPAGPLANGRNRGLAAVLSVADLLDEDAARCDTVTLIDHREGSDLNRAHWLRHALTAGRIEVVNGQVSVEMRAPPDSLGGPLKGVYSALRNHFRLVSLYEGELGIVSAAIRNIGLTPSTGFPSEVAGDFPAWRAIPGFANESALALQLMNTFMPIALVDEDRLDPRALQAVRDAALESIDLTLLRRCRGTEEPRSAVEQIFAALVG